MSIVIDLIIVGILVLCIALGYRRGLAGAVLKIISFALALIIAFVLFKPVSNIIIDNTNWDESLTQGIREAIVSEPDEETAEEEQIDIEKVLAETKPNLEIAEAGEENKSKNQRAWWTYQCTVHITDYDTVFV